MISSIYIFTLRSPMRTTTNTAITAILPAFPSKRPVKYTAVSRNNHNDHGVIKEN